jgi:hypothetical protein
MYAKPFTYSEYFLGGRIERPRLVLGGGEGSASGAASS